MISISRRTHPTRFVLTSILLMAGAGHPCRGGSPPPQVKAVLDEVRDTRATMYDAFESSTLGRTATPAQMAATQKDLRKHYMTPAAPLAMSEARKKELGILHGRVSLFGRPRAGKSFALGITGARVIDVEGRPELVVTRVDSATPAASVLKVGDVIIGANGRLFPDWEDPRVPVGYAIAAAQTQALAGMLNLYIGRDGKVFPVQIKLPVDGGYSATWPFDCKKSKAVAAAAVDYILQHGDDTFWRDLFLMGVGDAKAMAHVRDNLRKAQQSGPIRSNWHGGYKLVALAEYYLLTRDAAVLRPIRAHVRGLEANQMACGGWSHGAPGGYGVMNQVGQICFIGLILAEECGVKVKPDVLARAARLSGRFIGAYGAYGDHAPGVFRYRKGAPYDNGIVPAHAVLFHLLGEAAVARRSARRACYLYRTRMGGHAELIFSIAWSSVGAQFAPTPEFRMYADNMLWYYELARQPNGALNCLGHTRYRRSTAAVGMVFTLAEKRLRIAGAPRRGKPLFPVASLPAADAADSPPAPRPVRKSPHAAAPGTWDTLLAKTGVKTGPAAGGVLLRKSFDVGRSGYTAVRVTLPAGIGGELFLNGDRVAVFAKPARSRTGGGVQTLDLGRRGAGALRRGSNLLAARIESGRSLEITLDLVAGPGVVEKRKVAAHPPDHGNNNRNGWVGTYEQHRRGVAWFFADKPAKEIARYLAFPDWMGAQAAYQALAAHGTGAVPLMARLVRDSHAGIRVGAWDAVGVLRAGGLLSDDAKRTLAALAATRIGKEDPVVGEALGRAAAPMAKGEALAKILAEIAAKPDIKARELAVNHARQGLKAHPKLMIGVLRIVAASRLEQNTIRVLGGAMGGISRHADLPEARQGAKEIARVLDEVAPDMRGMFTDGLMHGGLAVIDRHLDAELEKTPQLVSGLAKCFVKVPDTDWPGWAYASLYFRRLHYRLGAASAPQLRRTVDELVAGADKAHGDAVRRGERMAELKAWATLLERTAGKDGAIKTEALRMADSADPTQRLVALSLVWPSCQTLKQESARYHGRRRLADVARIRDPQTRIAVAIKAAGHMKSNRPMHWLLIWQTALFCQDRPETARIMPSLGTFFDTVAFRQRGTFLFRAIDTAATLAKGQLGTPGETALLARGLSKTWSTSSTFVWYKRTHDKLLRLVKTLSKASAPAVREAAAAQQAWLENAPKAERAVVLDRHCPQQELRRRLEELRSLAAKRAAGGT